MAIENFTTYTEVDTGDKLTIAAAKITAADVTRNEDNYVYFDKTADHFDALDIDFEMLVASTCLYGYVGGMAISNTVGSTASFSSPDLAIVANGAAPAGCDIGLYLMRGYFTASDAWATFCPDTTYYLLIERAAGNDTATVKIYGDSAHTDLKDTLSVSGFGTAKWRYSYGFVNSHSNSGLMYFDGYIQNMNLNEAEPPSGGVITRPNFTSLLGVS